jgi:hypothetical protein
MYRRLFTQYCRIDELQQWEPDLARQLRQDKYVYKDGVKYKLNKRGIVERIDAFLCANPDPKSPSITEPRMEKFKARYCGQPPGQKRLLEAEQKA